MSKFRSLIDDCREGDLVAVKKYYEEDWKGEIWYVGFCEAIRYDQRAIVKYFVELGADLNVGKPSYLCIAAECGNLHLLKYLVSHGASLAEFGRETLAMAITRGCLSIVNYLLDRGVYYYEDAFFSALKLAKLRGYQYVIDYLERRVEG